VSSLKNQELVDVSILHLRDAEDELMYATGSDGEQDLTKPQRIHVYGPGTKQYAQAQAERNNRLVERLQRKGRAKMTANETIQERADFVAKCTKLFENIDSDNGSTGEDLYMETYLNPKLGHIAEQVELHARNTANFKQPSTTISASTSAKAPG
jgi:hypothetical protein